MSNKRNLILFIISLLFLNKLYILTAQDDANISSNKLDSSFLIIKWTTEGKGDEAFHFYANEKDVGMGSEGISNLITLIKNLPNGALLILNCIPTNQWESKYDIPVFDNNLKKQYEDAILKNNIVKRFYSAKDFNYSSAELAIIKWTDSKSDKKDSQEVEYEFNGQSCGEGDKGFRQALLKLSQTKFKALIIVGPPYDITLSTSNQPPFRHLQTELDKTLSDSQIRLISVITPEMKNKAGSPPAPQPAPDEKK